MSAKKLKFSRLNSRIHFGNLIYEAAKQGDWEGLELILSQEGAVEHINYKDANSGKTPLIAAAENGHFKIVKTLLAHKCDLHALVREHGQELHAWDLAAKNGKAEVANYLNGCLDDLTKYKYHRALMEADVLEIAQRKQASDNDVQEFCEHLNLLMKLTKYNINGDTVTTNPLLIVATKADNKAIVEILLEKYQATALANDIKTGETALHIACKYESSLRFYITCHCPDLIFSVDITGRQPLHVACQNNDVVYVSWLFQSVVEQIETKVTEQSILQSDLSFINSDPLPRKSVYSHHSTLNNSIDTSTELSSTTTSSKQLQDSTSTLSSCSDTFIGLQSSMTKPSSGYGTSNSIISKESNPLPINESQPQLLVKNPSVSKNSYWISPEFSTFMECTGSMLRQTAKSYGTSPLNLDNILKIHIKLFAIDASGSSILHIVAKNGCYELLELITGVAKYLEHNPDGADVTVLTRKDTSATPIEEAINANQSQCLRILLEFARDTYIFDMIYNDKCLLPRAVIANSQDCLKVFLEVGMWIGTKEALLVAVRNKDRNHLIRMLLFYYTQVALVSNDTRVKHSGAVTITAGTLHWNDLDLVELDPDWLEDAIVALSIVSHSLKVKKVAHPILENKKLFETLGYSCNDYFTGFVWQPRSHPLMFVPLLISEIDLSNNKLENIPPELFQVSSLVTLNLSKNKLTALPSNLDFQKPLYTCSKLIKLDLSSNYLQTLPEDLFFIMGNNIEELNAQNNRIDSLPPALWICTRLHTLLLGQNRLSKLHYYSDVKYFYSQSYSHDLINSLQVDKGSIKISESTSEEDFMHIMNYATRLGIFHQTVASLMPSLTERQEDIMAATGSLSFVQHAIDIHWLRAKLDQTKPLDYFDIILPQDEDLVLSHLDLSQNQFTEFPWDLPCIAPNLEKLDLRGNMISEIHLVCDMPVNIASIILGDNKLTRVVRKLPVYPCGNPINLATGYITNPEVQGSCKHRIHRMLDRVTNMILNDNKITYFPCVPPEAFNQPLNDLESYEKYKQKAYFPNLSVLSLDRNCLESVPNGIHYLTQLSSLSLSHNTSITQLPIEMGLMNPQVLLVLKLDGIFPKNIEPKVLNKPGTRAVLSYLKSLYHKSQPYYRMKLMFVGNSNVGKTTLLMNLSRKGKITRFKEVEKGLNKQPLSTVGVDLGDWELPRRPKITFMTWDFGGQEEYYATHQCFLTQRSLCILVWDGRDGIKGLKSIKVWLENIRGRVPGAPVMVVATHYDEIPSENRDETVKFLQSEFKRMYLNSSWYSDIYPKCFFVSSHESPKFNKQISELRDEIYEFALSIKSVNDRNKSGRDSLLSQPVPACYITLQEIVREKARICMQDKTPPILTRKEFRKLAVDNNFPGKLDELEEAAAFLHENGILLHYEDPSLSDLYFINPQWLCTMLACVVTVQEKNPFQKNGFMDRSALRLVLRDERFPHSFLQDFVSLMQKFEVVLVLDDDHLLIPSLLPTDKKQACTVLPFVVISTKSVDPVIIEQLNHLSYAPIHEINMKLYSRYYLIPYIPDGFFPRLIARIIGGDIATCFSECTDNSKIDLINGFHWKCWRSGIILIYHHMEIARVSMMELPYPNIENVYVTSSAGTVQLDKNSKGIEIVLAVLPDHIVTSGSQFLPLNDNDSYSNYLAVWMLRKLIETIDSVFEEWYEGFARRKKFDLHVMQQICPCPLCLSNAFYLINQRRNVKKTTSTNSMNRNTTSPRRLSGDTSYISYHDLKQWKDMYMFTGQFCVLEYSNGKGLRCANHDYIPVSSVAPDLAFSDFSPSMLFHKPQTVITKLENLGSGGFGSVNRGFIEDVQLSVAIKEFTSIAGKMIDNPKIAEEISSWDVYLNGSREARMMHRLRHPNVLGLVGLAFQPLRLLLELAPLGDLKKCLKPFKRDKVKLSRKVLRDVMYQVADAMEYIHSQSIIYRDLKPGNVLVWRFPQPKSQWNLDESVLIKLADYGISKHCTPEGARGSEGTPVYLPPEVILHGGAAAFTTKLDVYSFAMFMYYLFTYNGPFENEKGRPICSLLEKGKRPELNPKQQPLALQMYELMCWCWSDSPNHRPTFAQIKQIISSHSFVQLLKCVPLQSQDTFTVASLHTFKPTLSLRRRYKDEDLLKGKHSAASPSPSILQILSLNTDNDEVFNIYYGTRKGQIGIFQVFAEYDSCNPIDDVGCPVTCITSVGINVWIGTWGGGILVYNSATNAKIATWKANEGACVYKLLYVPEHGSMVVLSSQSFAIIDTSISKEEYIVQLETSFTYASDSSLTTGTVVLPYGYTDDTEVWCCSLRDNVIKIFSHLDLKVPNQESVPIVSSRKEMQLKHLVCYHKEEKNKVLISDNWFLQFWDVHDRQRERDDLNCSEICSKAYNGEVKNCSITSLLVSRSTIYIGTAGGIIIMLNVDSLEATYLLHGHDSDITSILSVSQAGQIRRFSRMLSKKDSFITTPVSPVFPETSSITSMASYSESVSYSESDVILSFGQGYSSILGESANYPSNFILPSHSSSSNLLASHNPRWMPSKSIKTSCILYWSSSDYYMIAPDELCQSSRSSGFTTIPETSIETAYSST